MCAVDKTRVTHHDRRWRNKNEQVRIKLVCYLENIFFVVVIIDKIT
jgi:hypothetical protein